MIEDEVLENDINIIKELNSDARIITTPWDDLSGGTILEAMEGSSNGFPIDLDIDEEHEHHHDEDDDEHHDHEEHKHHHHDHEEHEHEHHHEHDEEEVNKGLTEGNRIHLGDDDHEHHHHHHHHHDGHDADEVFDSIGIETINKYSEEEIKNALSHLPENIVRAKGIVPSKNGGWLFFDYVPGDIDIRSGSPAYTGLITIIGEKVDIELMKELFGVH